MKASLPQEIEIWYILPAIRKELTKSLIEKGLSQKEVAKILKVTEAAISNYISKKRASEVKFSKEDKEIINEYANKILKDKDNYVKYLYQLSLKFRKPEIICKLHKCKDKGINKNCDICFG